MPSYPDSVKSFVSKASGQNIDPAHVNDIQDEVNAIEAGLRNGTAPVNSSGSTVARLQVNGGSTLAGALNVTGGSTITTLQAAASTFSVRPVTPSPDAVRVNSTDVGFANNTTGALTWTADQTFITNSSMHSTGTNPERLTPQSTGIYMFVVNVSPNSAIAASTGNVLTTLEDSSGAQIADGVITGSGGSVPSGVVTGFKYFNSVTGSTQWVRAIIRVRDSSTNSASTRSWASLWKM